MRRLEIDPYLKKVDKLIQEMNDHAPRTKVNSIEFRADLAGLLVVTIASTYESCVKEIMTAYAASHSDAFSNYISKNYDRLNSRISSGDLFKYTKLFGEDIHRQYKRLIIKRTENINIRYRKDITSCYSLILSWRHDYAHAWKKQTTIEEAAETHKIAKHVIYMFNDAFLRDNAP